MTSLVLETSAQKDDALRAVETVAPDEDVIFEVKIVKDSGRDLALSAELSSVVLQILRGLADGNTVTFNSTPEVLSTTEAARMLGVSRPTLMKMIRQNRIPAFKVGTHTRIRRTDITAFREARIMQQAQALEEIREIESELDGENSQPVE